MGVRGGDIGRGPEIEVVEMTVEGHVDAACTHVVVVAVVTTVSEEEFWVEEVKANRGTSLLSLLEEGVVIVVVVVVSVVAEVEFVDVEMEGTEFEEVEFVFTS